MHAFEFCLTDSTARLAVEKDIRAAETLLERKRTPTTLIGGNRLSGTVPMRILDSLVKAALKK